MKRRAERIPLPSCKPTREYRCDECGCVFRTIPFAPCTRPLCEDCISRRFCE